MKRNEIAGLILSRLESEKISIRSNYDDTKGSIGYFFMDDLLPEKTAVEIYNAFPDPASMNLRKSLREHKFVAAQMDSYERILEEAVYAFQDQRVVNYFGELLEIDDLHPDEKLYAGGISLMKEAQFLNPHLDNSHDNNREKWRAFNLLYYVSPAWEPEKGGNLEIWPEGVKGNPITIHSKFNRLAVMATHDKSWHSVSPVSGDAARCCISNYYFSDLPIKQDSRFHVTSFKGRPEQKFRNIILQADARLRMAIRKLFSKGIVQTDHIYRK